MAITIGDNLSVVLNGKREEGFIIGIRPYRGQPPGNTVVWIEFSNFSGETKPNIQVVVSEENIQHWTIQQLEDWITKNAENDQMYQTQTA